MGKRNLLPAILISLSGLVLSAASYGDTDIDFTSIISGTFTDGEVNFITVTLHGVEVDLIVDEGTEIDVGGESGEFDDLSVDDHVKIEAFFATEGVVVEEIQVLDSKFADFRMRGVIQGVTDPIDEVVTITLLNTDVLVGPDTRITQRASRRGNSVPATDLSVGDTVNVIGTFDEMLHAERIHVGTRPQSLIEVEGTIAGLMPDADNPTSLTLEIGDDISLLLTVLINEDTVVGGELAIDAFAEVRGQLDENLNIIGFEIILDEDGDGDADDDNRRGRGGGKPDGVGNLNKVSISLEGEDDEPEGKAKYDYREMNETIKQNFEVEIEEAEANSNYRIEVVFGDMPVDFGTLTTDSDGEGEKEFDAAPEDGETDLSPLLPADKDVRDITAVNIYDSGDQLVLQGTF